MGANVNDDDPSKVKGFQASKRERCEKGIDSSIGDFVNPDGQWVRQPVRQVAWCGGATGDMSQAEDGKEEDYGE